MKTALCLLTFLCAVSASAPVQARLLLTFHAPVASYQGGSGGNGNAKQGGHVGGKSGGSNSGGKMAEGGTNSGGRMAQGGGHVGNGRTAKKMAAKSSIKEVTHVAKAD